MINKKIRPLSEAEFLGQVIDLAHLNGWLVAHFRPMRKANGGWETPCQADAKGFPDLFMVHPLRHRLAAELKVGRNRVTPEQDRWLDAMEVAGIPAFVWTPDEWDEIESVLKHGPVLSHHGIEDGGWDVQG